MRLEIIAFFVALGFFLYWKLGGKFVMPQIGGIGEKLGGSTGFLAGYLVPALLFIVLCFVLWLTNDTLHWWSFVIRDGKTFTALAITYFVFASAFLQDKEKKAPFYQKVMVFTMIAAVDLALMGLTPSDAWSKYGWGAGTAHAQAVADVSHVTQKQGPRTIEVIAMEGAFTEVEIPPATSFRWDIQEGCLVAVVHNGIPQGAVRDCAEHIELGDNIQNLRLGFSSKTEMPIRVLVTFTPLL